MPRTAWHCRINKRTEAMLGAPRVDGPVALGFVAKPSTDRRVCDCASLLPGEAPCWKAAALRCRHLNGGFNRFLCPVRRTAADGFGAIPGVGGSKLSGGRQPEADPQSVQFEQLLRPTSVGDRSSVQAYWTLSVGSNPDRDISIRPHIVRRVRSRSGEIQAGDFPLTRRPRPSAPRRGFPR
jgi:hypothetical protein